MRLAVIPARGGSKGIRGKNIISISGKPLIAWSIESALNSSLIDEFVVSTDSREIAEVSQKYGAKVLMRPDFLATDESTTIDVLTHISEQIPEANTFIVLQPTSPLREGNLIDDCINDYESGGYTNLATGYTCKIKEFATHNNTRRQDSEGFFYDDGSVYILDRDLVKNGLWYGDKIFKKIISRHQNYEIDDEVDFVVLECLIKKYKLRLT